MDCKLVIVLVLHLVINWQSAFGIPSPTNCGKLGTNRGPKIVGGTNSFEGEFPWMVSFKSRYGHFCGGFVISKQHVLSAAHCFWEGSNQYVDYDNGKIVLNSLNATIGEFFLKSPEKIKDVAVSLEDVILHENYNPKTKDNDLAIIKLKDPITIHPAVQPVCLPETSVLSIYTDLKATAAGWGKTDFSQDYYDWYEKVDALQKVEVKVYEAGKCRGLYKGYGQFPTTAFICAGEKGKESCTGDSGGPLMHLGKDNKWTAIGVVSVGSKCGATGKPGIYTDISGFTEWIDSNLK